LKSFIVHCPFLVTGYLMMQSRFDRSVEVLMKSVMKHPSAFVPIGMSLAALALVLGYVAMFGVGREPDEGAAAHVWQLLMAGQLPIVLSFAARWLPKAAGPAFRVLALQAVAILAACSPVYLLNL
jgi:hypothetical protein